MNGPSNLPEHPPIQRGDGSGCLQGAVFCLRAPDAGGLLPPENRAGLFILSRWIEDRLKRAGIGFISFTSSGALNKAIGMVRTPQPKRAAVVILQVLTEAEMLGFAEIAWWDADEGCYRTIHPKGTTTPFETYFTSGFTAEIAAENRVSIAATNACLEETHRALEELRKRLGREPPPVPPLPEQ